jgi:hypothetical protein
MLLLGLLIGESFMSQPQLHSFAFRGQLDRPKGQPRVIFEIFLQIQLRTKPAFQIVP